MIFDRTALKLLLLAVFCTVLPHAPVTAQGSKPEVVSLIISNRAGVSPTHAARSSNAAAIIASRLSSLGHAFATLKPDGTCVTTKRSAVALDIARARSVLGCLPTITGNAKLLLIYYVGPISVAGGVNVLALPASTAPATIGPLTVDDLAGASNATGGPLRVVIIDALEPRSDDPAIRASQRFVRLKTSGTRRIVAYSAPAGLPAEPGEKLLNRYTGRLLRQLNIQATSYRRGAWLQDIRDLLALPALVSSPSWPGRTSEVLVEGVDRRAVTLRGTEQSLAPATMLAGFLVDPTKAGSARAAANCTDRYREAMTTFSCKALFEFDGQCSGHPLASVASTALRLRCADQLMERGYKTLQSEFATAQKYATCEAMSAFVNKYEQDFELAAAPEFDKAIAERDTLCRAQRRTKEIAQLEVALFSAITSKDCATLKTYGRLNAIKLPPELLSRFETAMNQRCTKEQTATQALRTCLDNTARQGGFCSFSSCYDAFRRTLPQPRYQQPHQADMRRYAGLCTDYTTMQRCFEKDTCGGQTCSLPLRVAVKTGHLINFIEKHEQDAGKACSNRPQTQASIDATTLAVELRRIPGETERIDLIKGVQKALRDRKCHGKELTGEIDDADKGLKRLGDALKSESIAYRAIELETASVGGFKTWQTWAGNLKLQCASVRPPKTTGQSAVARSRTPPRARNVRPPPRRPQPVVRRAPAAPRKRGGGPGIMLGIGN